MQFLRKIPPRFTVSAVALAILALGWLVGSWWLSLVGVVLGVVMFAWFWVRSRRWPAAALVKAPPTIDDYDTEDIPSDITDDPDQLINVMLRQERYALLLRPQIAGNLSPKQLEKAQAALEEDMALVPEGDVFLSQPDDGEEEEKSSHPSGRMVRVEAALLDRYPVTNRQYKRFVDAGGYSEMALWDEEIWPGVFDFVDATGHAGPRWWNNGTLRPRRRGASGRRRLVVRSVRLRPLGWQTSGDRRRVGQSRLLADARGPRLAFAAPFSVGRCVGARTRQHLGRRTRPHLPGHQF